MARGVHGGTSSALLVTLHNWALNIYPHLHPGLCVLYAKTAGKLFQKALL